MSNDVPLMHYLVYGLGRKHTRTKCYRNGTDIELLLCLPTTQELIIGWTKVCLCRTGNEPAAQYRSSPDSPLEGGGFELSVEGQAASNPAILPFRPLYLGTKPGTIRPSLKRGWRDGKTSEQLHLQPKNRGWRATAAEQLSRSDPFCLISSSVAPLHSPMSM